MFLFISLLVFVCSDKRATAHVFKQLNSEIYNSYVILTDLHNYFGGKFINELFLLYPMRYCEEKIT